MSSNIKPIKLWGQAGANPPKVAIILEELDLPYETVPISFADVKKPEYVAINPNGRTPAIYDPNTNITLWESGAIIEYLIERYDTDYRLSFAPGTPESYHAKQWLFFQVSGQGPYFGQAMWFSNFHSEKIPSAIERYLKEINRVSGVLESWLKEQKKTCGAEEGPWLVGDKLSYADLSFVIWQKNAVSQGHYDEDEFPRVKEWLQAMSSREAVKGVLKTLQKL
jgi:glutathione S-transferase